MIEPSRVRLQKISVNESSNTDGSFTMAVSNLFLSPLENPIAADLELITVTFFFFQIENGILCVHTLYLNIKENRKYISNVPSVLTRRYD